MSCPDSQNGYFKSKNFTDFGKNSVNILPKIFVRYIRLTRICPSVTRCVAFRAGNFRKQIVYLNFKLKLQSKVFWA